MTANKVNNCLHAKGPVLLLHFDVVYVFRAQISELEAPEMNCGFSHMRWSFLLFVYSDYTGVGLKQFSLQTNINYKNFKRFQRRTLRFYIYYTIYQHYE